MWGLRLLLNSFHCRALFECLPWKLYWFEFLYFPFCTFCLCCTLWLWFLLHTSPVTPSLSCSVCLSLCLYKYCILNELCGSCALSNPSAWKVLWVSIIRDETVSVFLFIKVCVEVYKLCVRGTNTLMERKNLLQPQCLKQTLHSSEHPEAHYVHCFLSHSLKSLSISLYMCVYIYILPKV